MYPVPYGYPMGMPGGLMSYYQPMMNQVSVALDAGYIYSYCFIQRNHQIPAAYANRHLFVGNVSILL